MAPSPSHNEKPQTAAATTNAPSDRCCESPRVPAPPAPVGNRSADLGSENSKPNGSGAKKKRQTRTPTYYVRKVRGSSLRLYAPFEEKELLEKEVYVLEKQVELLRQRRQVEQRARLVESSFLNVIMREMNRSQQLSFAVAQSVVSSFSVWKEGDNAQHGDHPNPLNTFIRLGKDWSERHATLSGMKDTKIRNALEFAQARSQFLDPLKPHHSDERFENASGDYCCTKFELVQFEGAKSVKQVYDAILCYHQNIEISISERLGHITVRDDFDTVDQSIANYRLLSTQCGVDIETNVVSFAEFFESFEPLSGASCGILTADFVDDDELNPYTPQAKARRDVSVAIVLTPHVRKMRNRDGNEEEELVVVMTQGKFHRLSHAELELSPQSVQGLRATMCWGPVMMKVVQEHMRSECVLSDK